MLGDFFTAKACSPRKVFGEPYSSWRKDLPPTKTFLAFLYHLRRGEQSTRTRASRKYIKMWQLWEDERVGKKKNPYHGRNTRRSRYQGMGPLKDGVLIWRLQNVLIPPPLTITWTGLQYNNSGSMLKDLPYTTLPEENLGKLKIKRGNKNNDSRRIWSLWYIWL